MTDFWCCRCRKEVDAVMIPCFGKYTGRELCFECEKELRNSRWYRFETRLDYKIKRFFGTLLVELIMLNVNKKRRKSEQIEIAKQRLKDIINNENDN